MRTVVVTKNLPWPANSGEKMRTRGIVRALAGRGEVVVVGYAGPYDDPSLAAADGVEATWVDQPARSPRVRTLLTWGVGVLRQRSITAGRWWSPALARAVAHEVGRGADRVVVEHVQLVGVLPRLAPGVVTVLDMHNVESLLTRRLGETSTSWRRWVYRLEAAALARLERGVVRRFDVVSVASAPDREVLRALAPCDPVVVPNAIEAGPSPLPGPRRPTAIMVALMSWAPNAEAALWFTREVWPRVRAAVPEARLLLVGRDPGPAVRALAGDDVEVSGTVDDLDPWYARAAVALAPLLAGGGSRLKIMEALAKGRPVVATPVGAEGLEDLVGRGVLTAAEPAAMAELVAALLTDLEACGELGARGADAVRADHSWHAATAPLVEKLEAVG